MRRSWSIGEDNALAVLITGVTGRVGRNLASSLLAEGRAVRGLVLPDDPGLAQAQAAGVECVTGDLADPVAVAVALEGAEAVVHLGAAMIFGPGDNPILLEANIRGTYELAHAAAQASVRRFVFASSDEVYPSLFAKYLPIDETHPREPYSFYGLTKVAGEELLHYEQRVNRLPIAIARFSLVYEPWEAVSPKGTLGGFLFYEKVENFVRAGPAMHSPKRWYPLASLHLIFCCPAMKAALPGCSSAAMCVTSSRD